MCPAGQQQNTAEETDCSIKKKHCRVTAPLKRMQETSVWLTDKKSANQDMSKCKMFPIPNPTVHPPQLQMWILNHGIMITTQKIIHVAELLAMLFPAWSSCSFWSTSPGLSHKTAILYHWCRGHTISCNAIPCFVVPSILHILGLENTSSYLWRQCFCLQEAHKTGTTEPQLLLYNLSLPWSSAASSDIAEQSTPACWSYTLTVRDPQLGYHHQIEFPCELAQVLRVPGQGH